MSALPRRPWPSIRPSVMRYSRKILLPSTMPQPAAFSAGSMCSARVSASFMGWLEIAGEGLVQERFFEPVQRRKFTLAERGQALGFGKECVGPRNDTRLLFARRNWNGEWRNVIL